ncbi:family 43 glycosylhydrolase [Flavisolibacter ginsenosidimutans]|uniref:Family 43 glycosylhydrolase n=1 Tax=Flavisolibacter ginsenosidimutans TaxID=661481 RepID=A0A5B8UEA7_9BACT|nr:family 43 glycosylhydrolase [Flavisolibacter ginsenosidimutans]QEC54449.1 family 43 glycosylhydrolase [Flavisolibacter ginsenosidimutans]
MRKSKAVFLFCALAPLLLFAQARRSSQQYSAYLFAYFTGNAKADESIHFAISKDGYNFRALNSNRPVLSSEKISSTGGVRDPHILRGADGKTFYMVATDMVSALGWNANRAMVLLKSNDLIHWSSSVVNIQKRFPGNDSLLRVWAPQTIYDDSAKKYMIYFSMKHGKDPDKIYYAYANKDFTDLETTPRQLFFSPDNAACIDGDMIKKDGRYYLFFKTEDRQPGIKIAVSNRLTYGYAMQSNDYVQQTASPVEGAGTFKLNDGSGYVLMYDMYTSGRYQFTKTTDLRNFSIIDKDVSMNFHPRHGTVMPITEEETERLVKEWLSFDDAISSAGSKQIKKLNVVSDTAAKKLFLPVKAGTNLANFNPQFLPLAGVSVNSKSQNFTHGPVQYSVAIKGRGTQTYQVFAKELHNPVLDGLYADPDIIYAEKTKKFYIYPTSDGFNNWSGTYFKTFSSTDLVTWKDEGVILDLNKDVSWAKRNAWAPTVIERKINGQYKYFYYFCAAQKIGVAVADNPTGPFIDSGKPLIEQRPDGAKGGQQIDPDVFQDPKTGTYFLYWGNGYMAGAELNDDMISLKPNTTKLLTPDTTFREGTHVFYRNGTYYFMWSEDDTRSENYRVRYGTSDSPLGKIRVPQNNLVIAKDPFVGIYATGHNSTIQVPGRDEWYLVYHRFTYPSGISMGRAAGYNREVCIDKLEFNSDGSIKQVKPTHEGVKPIAVKAKD